MEQGRILRRCLALAAGAVLLVTGIIWDGALAAASSALPPPGARPDIIFIDAVSRFQALEMPPAVFPHDKHIREMGKRGQDCVVCHQGLAPDLQGDAANLWPAGDPFRILPASADKNAARLEQAFHDSCIGCHAKWDEGPQLAECRGCHNAHPRPAFREPLRMDKALHALHIASENVTTPEVWLEAFAEAGRPLPETNCGACHHSYDAQQRELVWLPGQEQACSVCHAARAGGNAAAQVPGAPPLPPTTPALKDAMHGTCVLCHTGMTYEARAAAMEALADKADRKDKGDKKRGKPESKARGQEQALQAFPDLTGPDTCAGCHSLATRKDWVQPDAKTPRLLRGQPDVTVILPVAEVRKGEGKIALAPGMQPVLFNHEAHEAATDSCSVCHHVRIDQGGCTSCHTVPGAPEGGNLPLASAMHAPGAPQSCVGCHQSQVASRPECAGCHGVIKPMNNSSCAVCHTAVPGLSLQGSDGKPAPAPAPDELAELAQNALAARPDRVLPLEPEAVPEKVLIDALSNEYQPATFPHRAVYKKLFEGMQGSSLASAFHTSPQSTCAACHHKSPVEDLRTPPSCASCHAKDERGAEATGRPSLKLAYHEQCMSCHARMDIKPAATDCAACHASRDAKPGRK